MAISCIWEDLTSDPVRDWTALSALSQIESLCFPRFVCLDLDLPTEIDRVRHLTELHIGRVELRDPGVIEALVGLTNLKSLGLYRYRSDPFGVLTFTATDSIREMTGLTKLETDYTFNVESIRHLTNLVVLRANILYYCSLDESPSLSLEHLEELDVSMKLEFRGKVFSDLPRLKRLCIRDDRAKNGEFLTALGHLTQLSHFSFIGRLNDVLPLEYCLQFNLLSSLRSLSICATSEDLICMPDPCDFLLEGSFPLLRSLHLEGFYSLYQTQNNELMRRFPCLNSLSSV